MSDYRYTDADAAFDAEQLHGPRCPRHGFGGCSCCVTCGQPDGLHTETCRDRDVEDEDEDDEACDDGMDGDHESALASAGWGTDEDYGSFGGDE